MHFAVGSQIFRLHFAAERCESLLLLALESQSLSLKNAAGSQILPLYDAAGSQILPLYEAAGNQILPPHDAAGSQFGSGESSQKTLEDSQSLMGQSCKKSHMRGLHYTIPFRIMY
jgi:hypothetical protein